jgi:hypothetical protein
MATKEILSTGDVEKDAQLLGSSKEETLVNKNTFEEAREKERRANEATAKQPGDAGASRNALTDSPHIEGQVLAIVQDTSKEKDNSGFMHDGRETITIDKADVGKVPAEVFPTSFEHK